MISSAVRAATQLDSSRTSNLNFPVGADDIESMMSAPKRLKYQDGSSSGQSGADWLGRMFGSDFSGQPTGARSQFSLITYQVHAMTPQNEVMKDDFAWVAEADAHVAEPKFTGTVYSKPLVLPRNSMPLKNIAGVNAELQRQQILHLRTNHPDLKLSDGVFYEDELGPASVWAEKFKCLGLVWTERDATFGDSYTPSVGDTRGYVGAFNRRDPSQRIKLLGMMAQGLAATVRNIFNGQKLTNGTGLYFALLPTRIVNKRTYYNHTNLMPGIGGALPPASKESATFADWESETSKPGDAIYLWQWHVVAEAGHTKFPTHRAVVHYNKRIGNGVHRIDRVAPGVCFHVGFLRYRTISQTQPVDSERVGYDYRYARSVDAGGSLEANIKLGALTNI